MMSTPWLPLNHTDYPLARLTNLPSIRMDFDEQPLSLTDADCETFGEDKVLIAARLCLTAPSKGRIEAGQFLTNNDSFQRQRTNAKSQVFSSVKMASMETGVVLPTPTRNTYPISRLAFNSSNFKLQ